MSLTLVIKISKMPNNCGNLQVSTSKRDPDRYQLPTRFLGILLAQQILLGANTTYDDSLLENEEKHE